MSKLEKETMSAAVIDRFGGIGELTERRLAIPKVSPDEILIKVKYAGVGSWDPFEREGGYSEMQGTSPHFPYVLGSEGAGTVAEIGGNTSRFQVGDKVYAAGFLNPKGGFYAEYVAVRSDLVSHIPNQLTMIQAAAMPGVGLTSLRGLDDVLRLKKGESILIFGASGSMGHVAVQLAKRMGARVFAVASGSEGVSLVRRLGADMAVDGHNTGEVDLLSTAAKFTPNGFDTVFLTAGGPVAEGLLKALRSGGRAAYPNGVFPLPNVNANVDIRSFNGEPDHELIERFNKLIGAEVFEVCISHVFQLENAADAHRALVQHHLGKIVLRVN